VFPSIPAGSDALSLNTRSNVRTELPLSGASPLILQPSPNIGWQEDPPSLRLEMPSKLRFASGFDSVGPCGTSSRCAHLMNA
jgi:hypothetical protein